MYEGIENLSKRSILVTGMAGFIGFHLMKNLLSLGFPVIGIDSVNDYYDVNLKFHRLKELGISADEISALRSGSVQRMENHSFTFYKMDLKDNEKVMEIFQKEKPEYVVHLAAQAGVRYSLQNPHAYIDANIIAFLNVLEGCRHFPVKHLVFASSSSVYGSNRAIPFSVHQNVDHPISLYAATKKSNELMAHAYSHLFAIPCTGLRFFTVYGPWGRPDMALFLFTERIIRGEPIDVYNKGRMKRDFTYIDDVVEGMARVMARIPVPDPRWDGKKPDPASSQAPYRLFNIGNNTPVDLLHFITLIEKALGRKARKRMLPMQPGDVAGTAADIDSLRDYVGFVPATPLEQGIARFIEWYKHYYGIG